MRISRGAKYERLRIILIWVAFKVCEQFFCKVVGKRNNIAAFCFRAFKPLAGSAIVLVNLERISVWIFNKILHLKGLYFSNAATGFKQHFIDKPIYLRAERIMLTIEKLLDFLFCKSSFSASFFAFFRVDFDSLVICCEISRAMRLLRYAKRRAWIQIE